MPHRTAETTLVCCVAAGVEVTRLAERWTGALPHCADRALFRKGPSWTNVVSLRPAARRPWAKFFWAQFRQHGPRTKLGPISPFEAGLVDRAGVGQWAEVRETILGPGP